MKNRTDCWSAGGRVRRIADGQPYQSNSLGNWLNCGSSIIFACAMGERERI